MNTPRLDFTIQNASSGDRNVSRDTVASIGDHAHCSTSLLIASAGSCTTCDLALVEILEASADRETVAEIRNNLDDVTTVTDIVRITPANALVDFVRQEQAEPVQGLVIAGLQDRPLLTSHDHGRVADRDISLVEEQAIRVRWSRKRRIALAVDFLELQDGLGRAKIGIGSRDELNPSVEARFPIFFTVTGIPGLVTRAIEVDAHGAWVTIIAPSELVLHFAGDLQAVGVGRDRQTRKAQFVTDVERRQNAQIGCIGTAGRETRCCHRTQKKAPDFHY